jgi:hypothetical protein
VSDILSFLIKPLDEHGPEVLTLTPVINDVPVTELIERFEREHRRGRDYSGFGPFTFELIGYKERIAEIAERI